MQSSNSDSATHPMEKIKECYNFMENQINESAAIIRRNFTRIQNAVFVIINSEFSEQGHLWKGKMVFKQKIKKT